MSYLSYKYRIKSATHRLNRQAIACNQIWNYCVSIQKEAQRRYKAGMKVHWPTAYELCRLTQGCAAELGLHSDTVTLICKEFVTCRDTHRKCPKYRSSFGGRKSLGWMPFTAKAVKVSGDSARLLKRKLRFWKSREPEGVYKCGTFFEDARGRWYIVLRCEVPDDLPTGKGVVGVDLGLKTIATLSDGSKVDNPKIFASYEKQLSIAQRAGKKQRVRSIHAKIKNARHHHLHEQSTRIVRENGYLAVGNVNAVAMAKTRMVKSVRDAAWGTFRHMLRYKARRHGAVMVDTDERWTTQTCSCCGVIPDSSPKGKGALGIRHWECSECGASHDRDVNAARNILRVGLEHQPLVEGIAAHNGAGTVLTGLRSRLTKRHESAANL